MMNILLLGKYGQVGWELNRTLSPLGKLTVIDYPEVDLARTDSLKRMIREHQPQVIINAASYTAVDRAESESAAPFAINRDAPAVIAEEAKVLKSVLIHFSTDYVFDGKKGMPYTEHDTPAPLNVYGRSKLEGERAIQDVGESYLILRTSCVYSMRRKSFMTDVLRWARHQETMNIVADQVGNPTWCRTLAETTAQVLVRGGRDVYAFFAENKGMYHLAGSGYASRYDWAREILQCDPWPEEQVVQQVLPATTDEFPAPAERPLFSALNCDRFYQTFGLCLPDWKNTLHLAMDKS